MATGDRPSSVRPRGCCAPSGQLVRPCCTTARWWPAAPCRPVCNCVSWRAGSTSRRPLRFGTVRTCAWTVPSGQALSPPRSGPWPSSCPWRRPTTSCGSAPRTRCPGVPATSPRRRRLARCSSTSSCRCTPCGCWSPGTSSSSCGPRSPTRARPSWSAMRRDASCCRTRPSSRCLRAGRSPAAPARSWSPSSPSPPSRGGSWARCVPSSARAGSPSACPAPTACSARWPCAASRCSAPVAACSA